MERLSFLFDLGNVLISCDFEQGAREIARQATATPAEIISAIDAENLICDYDQGLLTPHAFTERVRALTGYTGTIEELEAIWQRMLRPDRAMLDMLERLQRESYPTYILSNINPFHIDYVRREYPEVLRTNGMIFSCECSLIKPDEAIFHHTARELRIKPEATLFIDDRIDNIEAAARVGFRVLHHKATEETIAEIEKLL